MMAVKEIIDFAHFSSRLAPRKRETNKGSFGHVLIIGGALGTMGSVILSAMAALRCGAGLVSIATCNAHCVSISAHYPELMVHGVDDPNELISLLAKASVIVIGPGLGQSLWSQQLVTLVLNTAKPLVVDADALNLLAQAPRACEQWILTSHPGEAARLLACTISAIQCRRPQSVQQLQRRYGGVVVLKGAGTLVATAASLSICQQGNPGMATAGMGDVLSGVIGALLAQGFDLKSAAQCGVCLHAMAGDLAATALGQRGLIASDLWLYLHQLVNVSSLIDTANV